MIPEKMEQILREIDMGLWDNCLLGDYALYKSAKVQLELSNTIQLMAQQPSLKPIENDK